MLSDWILRLRSLFKRNVVEQELDDELRFHFEHLVNSHMRAGLARDEAVRRARLQFGGIDQIKEEHRDARGIRMIDDLVRDLRYAGRQILRAPAFAILAMLCLGLGIGVNTAIFGMVNGLFFRTLAVADADQVVSVRRAQGVTAFSYPAYREFRARSNALSGLIATLPSESDLDIDGESDFVAAEAVSANYGDVLGITPVLGRWFIDEREAAAVISHAVWERRFNRSPQAIGRTIRSGSETYTIIGVAPAAYSGVFAPLRTDLWIPIETRTRLMAQLENLRGSGMLMLMGRLRAGATPAHAAAELNAIEAQQITPQLGGSMRPAPVVAESLRSGPPNAGSRRVAQAVSTLMSVVVGLVLLIACVNVGNLLLVRGALRQREFAMRRALGASRSRLLRQLLTESLVLAIGGAIVGVVLAVWTNKLLEMTLPTTIGAFAMHLDISIDRRAIVFATLIALITTVLAGLLPAWRTSRVHGVVAFKGEIATAPARRRPIGLIVQVVVSIVLLFIAGSFVQALVRLQATDPGFEVAGRVYAYTWLPSPPFTPESRRDFYAQTLQRLRALPGVASVTLTSSLPLMPMGSECASTPDGTKATITTALIDGDYFATMGIDLVAGRGFTVSDQSTMVIVNETLARRIGGDKAAVGERVMVGCQAAQAAIVVGVVTDSAIRSIGEIPQPHLYRPLTPEYSGLTAILLETTTDPSGMVQPVRRALLELGQGIRVYRVEPLAVHVDQSFDKVRWLTAVLASFGILALILAAVGLYGTIAYRVTLRTQEIGVRMALGARRADIFREVVSYGLVIALIGIVIGEVLTAGLTGVVGAVQEGIRPTGAMAHIIVGLIWLVIAVVACYRPAARASRIDPIVALRHD